MGDNHRTVKDINTQSGDCEQYKQMLDSGGYAKIFTDRSGGKKVDIHLKNTPLHGKAWACHVLKTHWYLDWVCSHPDAFCGKEYYCQYATSYKFTTEGPEPSSDEVINILSESDRKLKGFVKS